MCNWELSVGKVADIGVLLGIECTERGRNRCATGN